MPYSPARHRTVSLCCHADASVTGYKSHRCSSSRGVFRFRRIRPVATAVISPGCYNIGRHGQLVFPGIRCSLRKRCIQTGNPLSLQFFVNFVPFLVKHSCQLIQSWLVLARLHLFFTHVVAAARIASRGGTGTPASRGGDLTLGEAIFHGRRRNDIVPAGVRNPGNAGGPPLCAASGSFALQHCPST